MSLGGGPKMSTSFTVKAYNKGQTIFREGQDGSYACIVNSGTVAVNKNIGGEQVTLATLGKGAVFGEMALLATEKRTATIVAMDYTEVVVLDRDRLVTALKSAAPLIQALMLGLVQRLAVTTTMVKPENTKVEGFMAMANLLQAWTESNPADDKGRVFLPVSKLADYSKATLKIDPPKLEQILADLSDQNLVKLERQRKGRMLVLEKADSLVRRAGRATQALVEGEESEEDQVEVGEEEEDSETVGRVIRPLDLYEFAEKTQKTPEEVMQMVASGGLPDGMLLFDRDLSKDWLKRQKAEQEASRDRQQSIDERLSLLLEDNRLLLRKALKAIGHDRLMIIMAGASPKSRRVILENLPADMLQQLPDLSGLKKPSEEQFRGMVEQLALEIRKLRGAAGGKKD